jgi:DNA-binding NarL/FixJ family response regulator
VTVFRYIVLEQSSAEDLSAAAAELAADDWPIVRGLRPPAGGRAVCVGTVADGADAGRAVLAAVAGARLVVDATAPREVIDELCDDLRRLGQLDHRLVAAASPRIGADERALLELLLGGATVGEAARRLHISRRTADRRLAAARRALQAGTTAEALRAAARLGVGRRR